MTFLGVGLARLVSIRALARAFSEGLRERGRLGSSTFTAGVDLLGVDSLEVFRDDLAEDEFVVVVD